MLNPQCIAQCSGGNCNPISIFQFTGVAEDCCMLSSLPCSFVYGFYTPYIHLNSDVLIIVHECLRMQYGPVHGSDPKCVIPMKVIG